MSEYQEHDKHILGKIYDFMCKDEGLSRLPLKFGRVGKGGAKCTHINGKPLSITIDTFTESQTLLNAVNEMRKDGREGTWIELDYYYNVVNNKDYSEIDAIY